MMGLGIGRLALGLLRNPLAIWVLAIALSLGAYRAGHWQGEAIGAANERAEQAIRNADTARRIREKIDDATSNTDLADDAALDGLLRGLAGETE